MGAAALLTVLAVSGCSDSDPKVLRPPDVPANVVTAGPETGDLFVYGTVSRGGQPVVGASVTVALAPIRGPEADVEPLKLIDLPAVRTDNSGRWAVRLDPADVPTHVYNKSHTYVNFEVRVRQPKVIGRWAAVMRLLKGPQVWRTEESTAADSLPRLDFDFESGQVIHTNSHGVSERDLFVAIMTD